MTNLELAERIKSEEETLCCLPFEPQYRARRAELTELVNLHRAMLVRRSRASHGAVSARGSARGDSRLGPAASAALETVARDCYAV